MFPTLRKIKFGDLLTVVLMISLMLLTRTHNMIFFLIPIFGSLFLIRRPESIFPLYYMSALSNSYFTLGGGQSAGRYLSLVIIFSLFIKANKSNEGKGLLPSIIFLLFLSFVSALVSYTGSFEVFFQLAQCFLLLYFLQKYVTIDINRLMIYIGIASAVVVLFVFFEAVSNSAFVFETRYRGEDEGLNANRIGMMMEQCAAMMMALFFLSKNKIIKTFTLVIFIFAAFVVIATGSRSSLLAIIGSIPICLFLTFGKLKKKIVIPIILLSLSAYFIADFLSSQDSQMFDRFTLQSIEETGGTGRADNVKKIITEIMPDHLLFGSGMGGGNMKALGRSYNLQNLAHNIIVDPLSQMGILIYPIFMFILYVMLKPTLRFMRMYRWYIVPIALISSAIINGIGETIFYEKFFWNDIALCVLCGNLYIKETYRSEQYGAI